MKEQYVTKGDISMNELAVFQNAQFGEIRIFMDENNEPWFCGKDVLTSLGYSTSGSMTSTFGAVPDQW